jgi:Tripartite tricarboxylate transporter TctB family
MMITRNLAQGLVLIAISLAFGLGALRYPVGRLDQTGPGLFPLLVSSLLFLIGVATVVRSLLTEPVSLHFRLKNIAIILTSLCGFTVVSHYVNMIAGTVFLVFCATLAGRQYSIGRNAVVVVVLIGIAVVLQKLFGFQLPLY